MGHHRERHVKPLFKKLCSHLPIVGIFGHRQVGKSTFLESNSKEYRTLDTDSTLANQDPVAFLKTLKGDLSAIDECQLAPPLFPHLKERVRKNQKPGQFLLSGSIRFTSRKSIRESLTGRIATLQLFPMVLSELRKDSLPDYLPRIMDCSDFTNFRTQTRLSPAETKKRILNYQQYFERGGLPAIFLLREQVTRERLMEDIIRTLLDRDLRLLWETNLPYSELYSLTQTLARKALKPIVFQELKSETSLATPTIKKMIDALEAMFVIRKIPIEGDNSKYCLWFEDQLEQRFLAQSKLSRESERVGLIYRNARAQFEYRMQSSPEYFMYQTRGGAFIPMAIRNNGSVLGIVPLENSEQIDRSLKASISSFLRHYNNSKVLIIVETPTSTKALDARTLISSVAEVF